LQLGWFTTTLVLDEDAAIAEALASVPEVDIELILAAIEDERTASAYEADKREARTAQGGPTHFQGKARQTDGPVRYSAPSLVFHGANARLEAGGFQPVEAYDVVIANVDPTLERRGPPDSPLDALRHFASGLTTQEVAAVLAPNNVAPDRASAESALVELVGAGLVRRDALADDALWSGA
jgi:hypothetical protein